MEETSELIKSDIGDRCFLVLVDEAHDTSIKKQMAVVMRCNHLLGLVWDCLALVFSALIPTCLAKKAY